MKHVHKYERRKLGSWKNKGHDIYKCAIPGCTHYLIDMEAVVGRYSLCWGGCSTLVEMTRNLVMNEKRKWPMCEPCKVRKREEREKFNQLIESEKEPNVTINNE